jgi:DNA-binding CsgD family transcriptional regulator
LSAGVLLVAPSGEVVFANRSAQRIVETWDGLRLEEQPGRSSTRLVADDTDTQAKLDEAIRRSVDGEVIDIPHFGLSLRIPRPSGLPAYALQFSALPEQNEFGQGIAMPRAIVFLTDSAEAVTIAPQLLSNLFGLTPAEARLAAELVQGDELADSAARLNISLNTAKSQLHSIYAKIGVDTRAKLSKMLLALAAQRTS